MTDGSGHTYNVQIWNLCEIVNHRTKRCGSEAGYCIPVEFPAPRFVKQPFVFDISIGYLQCRVSHDLLKGERIAAAIHQILASESVSERMDRSPFHASTVVVFHDGESQGVLSQEAAEFITEQIVSSLALTNSHVITQDRHNGSAEGNDLSLAVLRMPENNLSSVRSTS